ncbi:MAG: transcriptional repressor [Chloroflexi bacterium]|nr:transcriptional repressor [Chloroflexota bacterium]
MDSLIEGWVEEIESSSRKVSPATRAVLEAVAVRDGHFRAEEIVDVIPSIGRATVYRTLRLMVKLGLLCRVLLADGSMEYILSRQGHHHHLVCIECGSVADIFGCDVTDLIERVSRESSYQVVGHRIEIYGRCQTCRTDRA